MPEPDQTPNHVGTLKLALLADRSVVAMEGTDAERLLQGIITNDMGVLASAPALHAGLLTPQGKILFEFFVVRTKNGFALETAGEQATALLKRLTMYKLRAKVDLSDISADHAVLAGWGEPSPDTSQAGEILLYRDPRLSALGFRIIARRGSLPEVAAKLGAQTVSPDEYQAHRIRLGVPAAGEDYVLGEAFPHEADFDQLNGVSFSKGCFVGQEVVSRVQHRGTARKRIVPVRGKARLGSGEEVRAGAAIIGRVGSVADEDGLAMVRLDRAAEAAAKGEPLFAGKIEIQLRKPQWWTFDFPLLPAP